MYRSVLLTGCYIASITVVSSIFTPIAGAQGRSGTTISVSVGSVISISSSDDDPVSVVTNSSTGYRLTSKSLLLVADRPNETDTMPVVAGIEAIAIHSSNVGDGTNQIAQISTSSSMIDTAIAQ